MRCKSSALYAVDRAAAGEKRAEVAGLARRDTPVASGSAVTLNRPRKRFPAAGESVAHGRSSRPGLGNGHRLAEIRRASHRALNRHRARDHQRRQRSPPVSAFAQDSLEASGIAAELGLTECRQIRGREKGRVSVLRFDDNQRGLQPVRHGVVQPSRIEEAPRDAHQADGFNSKPQLGETMRLSKSASWQPAARRGRAAAERPSAVPPARATTPRSRRRP